MMRVWLVDDEALAVKRLSRMLTENGKVEIAGFSTDAEDALGRLRDERIDALFLDIEMPGLNGFELLSRLDPKPAVVFTTAYDQYAVKAFEANGIDYLLKPVSPEALDRAIAKLQRSLAAGSADQKLEYQQAIERLTRALAEAGRRYPSRIASRVGDRIQFIDIGKITHFFAEGKVTFAASSGKNHIVDESIVQLEAKLDPMQFQRIHRGYLVNLAAVSEICSWFGGGMIARLNDAARTELPIARDRVKSLRERLGS